MNFLKFSKKVKLMDNNPIVVVDIGASGGSDVRWSQLTDNIKFIMFEPDKRAFESLSKMKDNNLVLFNSALADAKKTISFYLCKKQKVSSVFKPNYDFLKKFINKERFEIIKEIVMEADTLDNQLGGAGINDVDFIKIDTQGCEKLILAGAKNTLKNAVGLEVEVEFAPIYLEQPLFADVDSFIRENGFELFDIQKCFYQRDNRAELSKGQLVFGNALYFKSPEKIFSESVSHDKIVRAFCCYLSYGYLDLGRALLNLAIDKKVLSEDEIAIMEKAISSKSSTSLKFRGSKKIWLVLIKLASVFSRDHMTDLAVGNYPVSKWNKYF